MVFVCMVQTWCPLCFLLKAVIISSSSVGHFRFLHSIRALQTTICIIFMPSWFVQICNNINHFKTSYIIRLYKKSEKYIAVNITLSTCHILSLKWNVIKLSKYNKHALPSSRHLPVRISEKINKMHLNLV